MQNEDYWYAYIKQNFIIDPHMRHTKFERTITTHIHDEINQRVPNKKKCSYHQTEGHNKSNYPYQQ